jgi:MAPEG family
MDVNDQSLSNPAAFRIEQRAVGFAMVFAAVISVITLGIAASTAYSELPAPFDARIEHTLRLELIVVAWLAATIANVARLRFFSARDIGGGLDSQSSEVGEARAVLQNTLEQVVLAALAHFVVAASFNPSASFITALVALFSVGRLLFWVGYSRGAKTRALGFALTFYPSVIALFGSAFVIVAR